MYILTKDEKGDDVFTPDPEFLKETELKRYNVLLKMSGIPELYHDLDFVDYLGTKSIDNVHKCKKYAENIMLPDYKGVGLYLQGEYRTQKTTIMCAIGKEAIRQGLKVKYYQAPELQDIMVNLNNFTPDELLLSEWKKIQNYYNVILIDDLFDDKKQVLWKNNGEHIIAAWDRFFRYVFTNHKRIIITSNTLFVQVGQKFSRAIYELLQDHLKELKFEDKGNVLKRNKIDELFED